MFSRFGNNISSQKLEKGKKLLIRMWFFDIVSFNHTAENLKLEERDSFFVILSFHWLCSFLVLFFFHLPLWGPKNRIIPYFSYLLTMRLLTGLKSQDVEKPNKRRRIEQISATHTNTWIKFQFLKGERITFYWVNTYHSNIIDMAKYKIKEQKIKRQKSGSNRSCMEVQYRRKNS